ncbi:MAG: Fic family protein [Mycoplasmatales bacterium]
MSKQKRNNAEMIALRYIKENIYNMTKLDGLTISYVETAKILDKGILNNVASYDVEVVINLKNAWNLILIDKTGITFEKIKKIHAEVGRGLVINSGELRNGNVGVNNVDNQPQVPIEEKVKKDIELILQDKDPINRSLEYLCYGIKKQLFYDGNKRTSFMVANDILLRDNIGIISVKANKYDEFNTLLKGLFDDREEGKNKIKEFLKDEITYQPEYSVVKSKQLKEELER